MTITSEATSYSGSPNEWLSKEDRRSITDRSHVRAFAILFAHYLLYFGSLYGALMQAPLIANLGFAFINGLAIALLFVIGHDGVHRAYAPSKFGNQLIARLGFIPCAHSASLFELVHNKNHHSRTNLRGVDCVWTPMDVDDYRNAPFIKRLFYRFYRSSFGPLLYYSTDIWATKHFIPLTAQARSEWKRHLPDSILSVSSLILTVGTVLVLGKYLAPERSLLTVFLVGWLAPFIVWTYIASFSFYVQHTHPNLHWFDDPKEWSFFKTSIAGTVHVDIPVKLSGIYCDSMAHTAHHAMPTTPIYKLAKAQEILLEKYGDFIIQYKFTPQNYHRVVKACKLYDYKNQHWTDFTGNATGPTITETPIFQMIDNAQNPDPANQPLQ